MSQHAATLQVGQATMLQVGQATMPQVGRVYPAITILGHVIWFPLQHVLDRHHIIIFSLSKFSVIMHPFYVCCTQEVKMTAREHGTQSSRWPRIAPSLQPWIVCLSAALFFFYEFIQMNMFNAISVNVMQDFGINSTQLGFLSATYFYADVVFLLPAGIILDRVSTRSVILSAMVVCITGTIGLALSHNIWLAAFFHFLSGIGNAFCFLSCTMLASRWFETRRLGLIIGLIVTLAMVGGMISQTPVAWLTSQWGWRPTVLADGMLGLVFMAIIWLFVYDYPAEKAQSEQLAKQQLQALGFWQSIRLSLSNRQNWLAGLYTSLLNLPIMVLGGLWGGLYLHQTQHFSMATATSVTMMVFAGTIVGSPLFGNFSDSIGNRRLPMVIGAVLATVLMSVILYAPTLPYWGLLVLFFALGFVTSSQVLSYALVAESNPRAITGTAMGIASVIIMAGGAIGQPLCGAILNHLWDGTLVNHVVVYSRANFQTAFSFIVAGFMIGLACVFFLKETNCRTLIKEDTVNA
jgi:MFS family permease